MRSRILCIVLRSPLWIPAGLRAERRRGAAEAFAVAFGEGGFELRRLGVVKLVEGAVVIHPPFGAQVVVVIDEEIDVFLVVLEGLDLRAVVRGDGADAPGKQVERLFGNAAVLEV